jgi:hypothetical protein
MDNMPNFGLDLPDDLESNELPFDTVCDYELRLRLRYG